MNICVSHKNLKALEKKNRRSLIFFVEEKLSAASAQLEMIGSELDLVKNLIRSLFKLQMHRSGRQIFFEVCPANSYFY